MENKPNSNEEIADASRGNAVRGAEELQKDGAENFEADRPDEKLCREALADSAAGRAVPLDELFPEGQPKPRGLLVKFQGKEKAVRITKPGTLRMKKTTVDGHLVVELNGVEIGGFDKLPPAPRRAATKLDSDRHDAVGFAW